MPTVGPLAAIYVRISQDREGKGLGVARQEQDCRELAEKLGYDVLAVYDDNDQSATRKKPRPEFVRLLEDTRAGRFQAILAWHTDRLYRRPADLQLLIDALKVHDVSVNTVMSGALDLSTASGRLNAGIYAQIAQHEAELKAERQRRKERELAEAGEPRTSVRAFGFENDGKAWRQPEAEMIQQATTDVLAGTSLAEIIRRWNNTPYKTARAGRDWNHETVRLVLTRWRNAGLRERNIRDDQQRLVKTELYPGTWEPLVTREQIEAVRNLLFDPKRRRNSGAWARKHLLSFFLVCGECGDFMRAGHTTSRTGKKYMTYVCGGLRKNSRGGNCRLGIMYETVDDAVRDHVAKRLAFPDPALLRATDDDREAFTRNHEARAQVEKRRQQITSAPIDDLDKLPMLARVKIELDALAEEYERLAQRGALAETMRGFAKIEDSLVPEDSSTTEYAVDVLKLTRDLKKARTSARERFDGLGLSTQRQIVTALMTVTILPAVSGKQYRGNRELSVERIQITDLDPANGRPIEDLWSDVATE